MKRYCIGVAIGVVTFAAGIVFTIVIGSYLGGDAAQAPAVLQPSSYGYSV